MERIAGSWFELQKRKERERKELFTQWVSSPVHVQFPGHDLVDPPMIGVRRREWGDKDFHCVFFFDSVIHRQKRLRILANQVFAHEYQGHTERTSKLLSSQTSSPVFAR